VAILEKQPGQEANRKRKATNQNETTTKRMKQVHIIESGTTGQHLHQLWKSIKGSKDILFLIRRLEPGKSIADWPLVQVDLDETDPNKQRR
jgi:hypothetical protein